MSLHVIKIDENNKWDKIVRSFKDCDVYYLSGYVKAFYLHGDGEPLLFYFDNGKTRAINVSMRRKINNKYFDLSTPYGYGGFLIEGTDWQELRGEYIKWCGENNIVSEFVRFHPLLNNAKNQININIYETVLLGNTVYIDVSDKDKIWNNFSTRNRNIIKNLLKNSDLKIYHGMDESLLNEFINLYNSTMDKNNADNYYYFKIDFYKSILRDLKDNALFFYVKYFDEIIAMAIILFYNNKMHYHLSGTKKQYQNLSPLKLILCEAAFWGSENNYKEFHLGGGRGVKNDSLYQFKKLFNKNEDKEFYIGKAVYDEYIYNNLTEIRKSAGNFTDSNYFPSYRQPMLKI